MKGLTAMLITMIGTASPEDKLAATIYGEAGGERFDCRMAVASVIWKDAKGNPKRVVDCALKPGRFCCWRDGSVDVSNPDTNSGWIDSKLVARWMLNGKFVPNIDADFFHDERLDKPPKEWGKVELTAKVGGLLFYKRVSHGKYL